MRRLPGCGRSFAPGYRVWFQLNDKCLVAYRIVVTIAGLSKSVYLCRHFLSSCGWFFTWVESGVGAHTVWFPVNRLCCLFQFVLFCSGIVHFGLIAALSPFTAASVFDGRMRVFVLLFMLWAPSSFNGPHSANLNFEWNRAPLLIQSFLRSCKSFQAASFVFGISPAYLRSLRYFNCFSVGGGEYSPASRFSFSSWSSRRASSL